MTLHSVTDDLAVAGTLHNDGIRHTTDGTITFDAIDLDEETAWQLLNALDAWHKADLELHTRRVSGELTAEEQDTLDGLIDDVRDQLRVTYTPDQARSIGLQLRTHAIACIDAQARS